MDRSGVLHKIYSQKRLIRNFDFDGLFHLPICNYLSREDIYGLKYLATSAKYSGISKNDKIQMMNQILAPRGFKKMTTGTNRAVYTFENDQSFLLKIALDDMGIRDSPAEMFNQQLLKPFVPKVFDVTPCGTIGMYERVDPILNRYEFENIAEEIFDIAQNFFLGRFVLEDIGNDFFKNWGLRDNFGPVLLDFPYLYEIDGNKLKCNKQLMDGSVCKGYIDYDDGLNTLVCESCGQRYAAKDLGANNGALSVQEKEEENTMIENFKVKLEKDGKVYDLDEGSDYIVPGNNGNSGKRTEDDIRVSVIGGENIPSDTVTTEPAKKEEPKPQLFDEKVSKVNDTSFETIPEQNVTTEASATDLALINGYLIKTVQDFEFSKYPEPNQNQRRDMLDYLLMAVLDKYPGISSDKAVQIVSQYVDNSYKFIDESQEEMAKAEKLAKDYLGNVDVDSIDTNEKMPRRRVCDDL